MTPSKTFTNSLRAGGLALFLSALAAGAQAQQPPGGGAGERPHRGPPPEALDACKALKAGAACSFTSPRGAEKGTCFAPEGKPLACKPAGMSDRPAGGASAPKR